MDPFTRDPVDVPAPPTEALSVSPGPSAGGVRELFFVTSRGARPAILDAEHRRSFAGWRVCLRAATPATIDELQARHPHLMLVEAPAGDDRAVKFIGRVQGALGSFAPPTVALISGDAEESYERAYALGAVDVLAMPVAPALLRVKLERHARREDVPAGGAFGPFRILRLLGRGGNGTVFLAEAERPRGPVRVALKVVPLDAIRDAPESLARFQRECDALRMLRSERIPRLVEAGRVEDSFYCAMEFIPGENLNQLLARGRLGEEALARLVDEVAASLEELHQVGLVHRDVKPANVIVTPEGIAKLVDFGLAKSPADPSVTRCDELLGTPPYMAPELARGEPATPATDAFALGMTALEAALGVCPVDGTAGAILSRRAAGHVPPVSELVAHLGPALRRVIAGLVVPEASRRLDVASARRLLARGDVP